MLKSQAGRCFARKTSVLGLLGTGVLFAGSAFTLLTATPAQAATPKTYTYTCSGGPFTNTSISVTVTPPDSATAGGNFELALGIPALTLATASQAATNVQVTATLTPTPGSVFDPGAKTGGSVAAGTTSAPLSNVTYKIAVPTGSTGNVSVKPGELRLALASSSTSVTTCTTTSTEAVTVPIGTGGGGGTTGTDVVQYECTGPTASEVQDVEIKVELTMPTSAKVGEQFAIKWKGTYTTGKELKAPSTGQTISPKIFAYAALTGISGLTSATGDAATGAITAGGIIPLPQTAFDVKTTAHTAGTATVKPAKVNFGVDNNSGNQPAISCTVQNDTALKTYTLTVGAGTSPTSSSTPTSSPKPTKTTTAYVTVTPSATKSTTKRRSSQTPKAGADTGAGGEMGPDGRVFILTGSALVAAAAVGGLWMRRRGVSRS
ncbi:hypothetical protein AB0L05_34465 [Nonomuraea pusilla]|uniref:hypothetical protein n=1 Tax=Nonomuraea pusilla TaxID=46177 RepID=UPI00331F221B